MSVEPPCEFCGVYVKPCCRSESQAADCPFALASPAPVPEKTPETPATSQAAPDLQNPKDALANDRLPLHLVPDTIEVYAALAFAEGAIKYGAYNWRVTGVRASVYHSALKRHLAKWHNGEQADATTGVPHLASVIACAGILLDSELCGKLTDDRPAAAPLADLINGMELIMRTIAAQFGVCGQRLKVE